jgi:hypothetical protein
MRRRCIFGLVGILLMAIAISSCQKEYFQLDKLSSEMEIQPNLVAPLVNGSLLMGDIVELFDSSGYAGEFEDGLIYLAYSDTFVNLSADSLDLLPDNYYNEYYLDPEIGTDPVFLSSNIGDTVHFQKSTDYSVGIEGESRLDSIIFKGGLMQIDLSSDFRHRGVMTISSDYIRDPAGNSYSNSIIINTSTGGFTGSVNHSLEGYTLETVKRGDSSIFTVDYDLALINSGNPISPGETCGIVTGLLDPGFYGLFGYIDPVEVLSERGAQDIAIFTDFPALSHLKLADPRIDLFTESSLGIPFELTLDSVFAFAEDGSSLGLEFYEAHPFKIPAPTLSQLGEKANGEFNINNQTSNFHELMNLAPERISYRVTGGVDSDIADQNHFLLDTSRFVLEADFLLPLDLRYTRYALADTLEFEIGDGGIDTAMVKDVELKISTVNELPIELDLQLFLLDETHMLIDSVFEQEGVFLPASAVNPDGILQSASEQTSSAHFYTEKLARLDQVRYIYVRAGIVTAGDGTPYVKFYSDYSLDFEISLNASLKINTKEL